MGNRSFAGLVWYCNYYCCIFSLHYAGIVRSQSYRLNHYDTDFYNNSASADYYPVKPNNPITYAPQSQRASNGSYIIRILLPDIVRSNATYPSPSNCSGSPKHNNVHPPGGKSYTGYNFPKRRWYPYNEAPVNIPYNEAPINIPYNEVPVPITQYNVPPDRPYMPHQQNPQVIYQTPQYAPNPVPPQPPYQAPQSPPGPYQLPPVNQYSLPKGPYPVPVSTYSMPVPPPPPEQPAYNYDATTTRAKDYVTPVYYETSTAAYYPEHTTKSTKPTYTYGTYATTTTPYPLRYETTKGSYYETTSRKYSPTKRYRKTTVAYKAEGEYERPTNGTVYEEYQPDVTYKPKRPTTTKRPVRKIPRTTPKVYDESGEAYEMIPTKRTTKKVVYRRKPKLPANEDVDAGE